MQPDYEVKLRIGRYFIGKSDDEGWFIGKQMTGAYRVLWKSRKERIKWN
jgi:hypothetical protein